MQRRIGMQARGSAGRARSRHSALMATPVAAVIAATLIAGCGGGGESSAGRSSPGGNAGIVTPAASGQHGSQSPSSSSEPAVAYVSGTPITKVSYERWLAVENASGATKDAGHRALAFLITASWVMGEAAHRHLTVSKKEVEERLHALEKKSFPKKGQLQAFLKNSHESTEDLLTRVKVELLTGLIKGRVLSKASGAKQARAALASFEQRFKTHWRPLTDCKPRYVMEDCRQYKGSGEPALSAPVHNRSAGSGSTGPGEAGKSTGGGSSAGSSSSSASGEVYKAPGSFSLESPAFTGNGPIPAKYTCDGAGISPPLSWSNVPKHAAELVIFVIDDTASGSSGGIRWVMGGVSPESHGVAAGQTPAGAIVGSNAEGKSAYGPICPAKGKTDTIELVAYALKRPIKLSPGFQPAQAEQEYGSTKDLLGEAAVSYATYHRK